MVFAMKARVILSLLVFYFIFYSVSMLYSAAQKPSLVKNNTHNIPASLETAFSSDNLANALSSEVNVPADATAGPNITRNFQPFLTTTLPFLRIRMEQPGPII